MQFVQPAHLMLLLLINIMSLFDLHLIRDHQILLIVLFGQRLLPFLLEQLDLRLGVELVDLYPSDLVIDILELDLLLLDVLVDVLGLLQQIRGCFLDGSVLALLVVPDLVDLLGFAVQLHYVGLDLAHRVLNGFLLLFGQFDVLFGVCEGLF